jgi:hypothetical protein
MRWHRSFGLIVTDVADFRFIYRSIVADYRMAKSRYLQLSGPPKRPRMNNEELSEHWDSISTAIRRIIKRVEQLPEREQDREFSNCLGRALDHSERRADALIDLL